MLNRKQSQSISFWVYCLLVHFSEIAALDNSLISVSQDLVSFGADWRFRSQLPGLGSQPCPYELRALGELLNLSVPPLSSSVKWG